MNEFAEKMNALIIYAEHRYYGESLPLGNDSFTKENIQYLTVENALADFAGVIVSLRKAGHQGNEFRNFIQKPKFWCKVKISLKI